MKGGVGDGMGGEGMGREGGEVYELSCSYKTVTVTCPSGDCHMTAAHREGVDGVDQAGVRSNVPLVVANVNEALKQVRRKESDAREDTNYTT